MNQEAIPRRKVSPEYSDAQRPGVCLAAARYRESLKDASPIPWQEQGEGRMLDS